MDKAIIGIFLAGNLATKEEEKLIDKYSKHNVCMFNIQTFNPDDTLTINCAVGLVPEKYKHLPKPEEVIDANEKWLDGVATPVGGLPDENKQSDENSDDKNANTDSKNDGFGKPPVKPN